MAGQRRSFVYSEFVARWRWLCQMHGLDSRTGCPLETEAVYRVDGQGRRTLDRVPVRPDPEPAAVCEPAAATWWHDPALWADPGPCHSVVEAQALANVGAQARAASLPPVHRRLSEHEALGLILEVMGEMRAERIAQHVIPLRELHARRGVTVDEVAGLRMEVAVGAF